MLLLLHVAVYVVVDGTIDIALLGSHVNCSSCLSSAYVPPKMMSLARVADEPTKKGRIPPRLNMSKAVDKKFSLPQSVLPQ